MSGRDWARDRRAELRRRAVADAVIERDAFSSAERPVRPLMTRGQLRKLAEWAVAHGPAPRRELSAEQERKRRRRRRR